MTETVLLLGSLSNDLFRVASLYQRGSSKGAERFLAELKRWSEPLSKKKLRPYIQKIVAEINTYSEKTISDAHAEKYLMFGVLLQNFVLHNR